MRNILILEDEYFEADDCAKIVKDAGFEVIGPFAFIDQVSDDAIEATDGAILDVNLGGEMVYAILDRLCAKHIPIVLLTGYDRGFIPPRFASLPVFTKPDTCETAVMHLTGQVAELESRRPLS